MRDGSSDSCYGLLRHLSHQLHVYKTLLRVLVITSALCFFYMGTEMCVTTSMLAQILQLFIVVLCPRPKLRAGVSTYSEFVCWIARFHAPFGVLLLYHYSRSCAGPLVVHLFQRSAHPSAFIRENMMIIPLLIFIIYVTNNSMCEGGTYMRLYFFYLLVTYIL